MDDVTGSEPSWVFKGWPHRPLGTNLDEVVSERLNVFDDDFLFPVATISATALDHNIETMATFCSEVGVSIAPHAKTTMSPEIIDRQLRSGAWAITAATASQARTFRQFGVDRILIAHQVVDPAAVRWIAAELDANPEVQIMCLVDSVSAVTALVDALETHPAARPLDVLVELGVSGGRSGCRSIEDAVRVAHAVDAADPLRLVGVEGYEGVLAAVDGDFGNVDRFLGDLASLATRLDSDGLFDDLDEMILTAGGSMFPDRAVAMLSDLGPLSTKTRVVIRSGCYVTHDSGMYETGGPFGQREPMADYPALQTALMVWAYVVSRPEPDLAILGFGKRDASYDVALPTPLVIRRNGATGQVDGALEVYSLNDQHTFVSVSPGFDISVGDIIGSGISHPCTTFDKWRAIPLVSETFDVVGAIRTFF